MKLLKVMSQYIKKQTTQVNTEEEVTLKLTPNELEALLIGLGEATFKGRQVEAVYKLAIKLQIELDKIKNQ